MNVIRQLRLDRMNLLEKYQDKVDKSGGHYRNRRESAEIAALTRKIERAEKDKLKPVIKVFRK
jgi:hypothetical protein